MTSHEIDRLAITPEHRRRLLNHHGANRGERRETDRALRAWMKRRLDEEVAERESGVDA
jgi:hypothetical protein